MKLGGKAAISGIMDLRKGFQCRGSAPPVDLLSHVLAEIGKIYSRKDFAHQQVSVPEAIVDLWEKLYQRAQTDGDVRIVARGGDCVKVHSLILMEASQVLKAMLQSPMKEGHNGLGSNPAQEIKVDEPTEVVQCFVGLLYTGGFSADAGLPSVETFLGIFGLCHRWQILGLIDQLESRLAQMVAIDDFDVVLEVALLHGAQVLKKACLALVEGRQDVRERMKRAEYSSRVLSELRHVFSDAEPFKRQRVCL